jgi:hypothetical protein
MPKQLQIVSLVVAIIAGVTGLIGSYGWAVMDGKVDAKIEAAIVKHKANSDEVTQITNKSVADRLSELRVEVVKMSGSVTEVEKQIVALKVMVDALYVGAEVGD